MGTTYTQRPTIAGAARLMQAEPPLALTIAAASSLIGVGRTSLYEAMKGGELKSFKLCGRRLILREDVYEWVRRARDAA